MGNHSKSQCFEKVIKPTYQHGEKGKWKPTDKDEFYTKCFFAALVNPFTKILK